jgi:halocyanin-like protein
MDASRRTLLALGGSALPGTIGGCLQFTDPEEVPTAGATATESSTATPTPTPSAGEVLDAETLEWLGGEDEVTFADRTGSDTATVTVGNADNEDEFDPAALRVTTGTTVTWEWAGIGTTHNVVSAAEDPLEDDSEIEAGDGPLDSGGVTGDSDATYDHTFESTGTYRYYCQPHYALGARGVVVVV